MTEVTMTKREQRSYAPAFKREAVLERAGKLP
jgi:hypothetical protein